MKKVIFCNLIFLFSFTFLYAQDWAYMIRSGKYSVKQIQDAFYTWYEDHSNDGSGKESGLNNNCGMEEDGNFELFKRWEWHALQRSYPSGQLPPANITVKNFSDYITDVSHRKSAVNNSNWSYAGNTSVPGNGGDDGRINHVRFLPDNSNTLFACAPTGGLWKSTDGGSTWQTNTDQLLDIAVSDVAINPENTNIMYLATGDGDGLDETGYGVLKSTDGGNTWNSTGLNYSLQTGGENQYTFNDFLINPDNPDSLFAATSFGLFYSQNGGTTFTKVIDTTAIMDVEFQPTNTSVVYASGDNGLFYRSTDGGLTFNRITAGLPSNSVAGRIEIGVTPANPAYVYLVIGDAANYGFYGFYFSSDTGRTFVLQSNSPNILGWNYNGSDKGEGQEFYDLSIAVSPTNADSVFVGGIDIWCSANGGVKWTAVSNWEGQGGLPYVHSDIHHINFFPGSSSSIIVGCDGGIYISNNSGKTWNDFGNNLGIGEQYAIGLSSLTSGLYITGWQDNGTNLANGSSWYQTVSGDGMDCFIDFSNDQNMFAETYDGNLYYTTDGGVNWYPATSGINETGPWVTYWQQDPMNAKNLVAGFTNVWYSANEGGSWHSISTWGSNTDQISAITFAPSNDSVIYAARKDAIYSTTNIGAVWNNISNGLPVKLAGITGIAVDPYNSKRLWVTFSDYSATSKVFSSVNGGMTWSNLSTGLPNLPVNCIVYQKNSPDAIYIGTDVGVYYHDTILNNWISYNSGLPNVMIDGLKIYQPTNTLIAASYGRGTWQSKTYLNAGIKPEIATQGNLIVYPNPSNGLLNIELNNLQSGNYVLTITDMLGQIQKTGDIKLSGNYNCTVDISGNQAGVYFITVNNRSTQLVKKIVLY